MSEDIKALLKLSAIVFVLLLISSGGVCLLDRVVGVYYAATVAAALPVIVICFIFYIDYRAGKDA